MGCLVAHRWIFDLWYGHRRASRQIVPINIWIEGANEFWMRKRPFAKQLNDVFEVQARLFRFFEPSFWHRQQSRQILGGDRVSCRCRQGVEEERLGVGIQ